jgi:transcriptional regulator of acetoin/glycerol metabolism
MAPSESIDAPLVARALPPRPATAAPALGDLSTRLAAAERQAFIDAIAASNGSKSAAARRLGVSRSQFYEKLKRHEI